MNDELRYFNSSKNWWKFDPKWAVVKYVGTKLKILDVGCSYGDLGEKLKQKGCYVDGVELYEPAANAADKILNNVFRINIDNRIEIENAGFEGYDLITFMDVLEHTIDPTSTLNCFSKYLNPNGRVIVSLPNIANIVERFNLLLGRFDYKEYGVLDKTHLRFFTLKSALEMMHKNFQNVQIIECTPRYNFFRPFVKFFPGLLALQFVILAGGVIDN